MAIVSFRQPHSLAIRLWHWINFILIAGLLLTVLILNTFLSTQHGVAVIKSFSIVGLTDEASLKIAKGFRNSVWDWHKYMGYALSLTFLFRIVTEIYTAPSKRLSGKLKEAIDSFKINEKSALVKHFLLVKISYVGFYLVLLATVVTGILISFYKVWGISKNIAHSIKGFHGILMYLTLAFILLHLIGVIREETKGTKGIVSNMISGQR